VSRDFYQGTGGVLHKNKLSLLLQQLNDILNLPKVIGDSSLHSGRDAQALVNPNKVVVHEMQGDGVLKVFDL